MKNEKNSKWKSFGFICIGIFIGVVILSSAISISFDRTIEYNTKILNKAFNLATSLACMDTCLRYDDNCSYCHNYWDKNKINYEVGEE